MRPCGAASCFGWERHATNSWLAKGATKLMLINEVIGLARLVLSRVPRRRLVLPLLVVASLASMASTVLAPVVTGSVIDALALGQERPFIRSLLVFFAIVVVQLALMISVGYGVSWAEESIGRELRNQLARAFLVRRQRDGGMDLGDVTARIVSDSQRVQSSLSTVLLQPVVDVITVLVAVGLVLRSSLVAGALLALAVPCSVIVNRRLAKRLEDNAALGQITVSGMMQTLQSWLGRAPWLHVFGITTVAEQRVSQKTDDVFRVGYGAAALRARISILALAVMLFPQVLILAVGGRSVLNAELTIGALVSLLGLSGLAVPPLGRVVGLLSTTLPTVLPSYRRVLEPLAAMAQPPAPAAALTSVESLAVEDYAAGSAHAEEALVGVPHLVARRGELVCIRGDNASGKTTFLTALLGLVPGSGKAHVRSREVETPLSPEHIAFAPAEPIVFEGSTEQNLCLFREPDVATMALADSIGLSGRLSASALELSRGELTKLMIARALLMERPITILDEPTLGLDSSSVAQLIKTLRAATKRGPVLVVTHDERLLAQAERCYRTQPGSSGWELVEIPAPSAQTLSA
jgi:ABC-type multidrug transport system fused ATPase/permease subunit